MLHIRTSKIWLDQLIVWLTLCFLIWLIQSAYVLFLCLFRALYHWSSSISPFSSSRIGWENSFWTTDESIWASFFCLDLDLMDSLSAGSSTGTKAPLSSYLMTPLSYMDPSIYLYPSFSSKTYYAWLAFASISSYLASFSKISFYFRSSIFYSSLI